MTTTMMMMIFLNDYAIGCCLFFSNYQLSIELGTNPFNWELLLIKIAVPVLLLLLFCINNN